MIKTRVLFNILMLLVLFSTTNYNYAQQKAVAAGGQYVGKSTKFAVMIGDVLHFRTAIQTAEELQSKKNKYAFEIIIAGELAKIITKDKSLIKDLEDCDKIMRTESTVYSGSEIISMMQTLGHYYEELE